MMLNDKPGMWINMSDDEYATIQALYDEIVVLSQDEPRGKAHEDALAELERRIGFLAACAAIDDTEGTEAEARWKAKNYSPVREFLGNLAEAIDDFGDSLRRRVKMRLIQRGTR